MSVADLQLEGSTRRGSRARSDGIVDAEVRLLGDRPDGSHNMAPALHLPSQGKWGGVSLLKRLNLDREGRAAPVQLQLRGKIYSHRNVRCHS
jgi:hypothetical protein